jgi:hypothetical protein
VKLRPVVPNDLSAELRDSRSFGVEVDGMPGGFVCSGSMTHTLGPRAVRNVVVLKLKFGPEGYDRKMVGELWLYPDNSMILELSTKCAPTEAFQVAAEARAFLTERGVDLSGEQETKTKKALEFFSQRLQAEGH